MKLGSPQTSEYSIGTAEVRVGPLTEAMRMVQARSIGLVDNATVSFNTTSVDLMGGFPQELVDTAVTQQSGSVRIAAREFSRRNLDIQLGNAISATAPTGVATTLVNTANVAADATSIVVEDTTGFAVDDVIVIYPDGRPEDVTISQISAINTGTDTITLKTGMGTVVAYPAQTESTKDFHVFKGLGIAAGAVTRTNYFSMMLIQQKNKSGRPIVWNVWKAANSGSMEQGTSATEYGTLNMEMKILKPSAADIGAGGDLNALASLISLYPTAFRMGGEDQ